MARKDKRAAAEERRRRRQENRRLEAQRERERRERRLAALAQRAADFLRAGGVDAAAGPRALRVGQETMPVREELLHEEGAFEHWLDQVALEVAPQRLEEMSRSALGDRFDVALTTRGVLVHLAGEPLALARPTHATFGSRIRVPGNFLIPGAHWDGLRRRLLRRIGELADEAPADEAEPATRVLRVELPRRWRRLAERASEQLRTERALTFGHTIVISGSFGELRLEPLRSPPLELPVAHRRGDVEVRGAVRLASPLTPLPFVVEAGDDGPATEAWILAMVAYARLTCVDPPEPRQGRAGAAVEGRSGGGGPRAPRSPGATSVPVAAEFEPVGLTKRWLASYVAGHRRRLAPGQRASDEARRHAERVGIALRPGETWVQPHLRGAPDDTELTFRWQAPVL